MQQLDVHAVVGACEPERARYATALAHAYSRMLVSAADFDAASAGDDTSPLQSALWTVPPNGIVVEFPTLMQTQQIIASCASHQTVSLKSGG